MLVAGSPEARRHRSRSATLDDPGILARRSSQIDREPGDPTSGAGLKAAGAISSFRN